MTRDEHGCEREDARNRLSGGSLKKDSALIELRRRGRHVVVDVSRFRHVGSCWDVVGRSEVERLSCFNPSCCES